MSHRTFARRLYVIAAATLAAVILAAAAYTATASASVPQATPEGAGNYVQGRAASPLACAEDMPCWNWATMGNHRRGIVTVWGTPKIVGPRAYCREYRHTPRRMRRYFIRTNRLRGDFWVLHTVCNL